MVMVKFMDRVMDRFMVMVKFRIMVKFMVKVMVAGKVIVMDGFAMKTPILFSGALSPDSRSWSWLASSSWSRSWRLSR